MMKLTLEENLRFENPRPDVSPTVEENVFQYFRLVPSGRPLVDQTFSSGFT